MSETTRNFVMSHLHSTGAKRHLLTDREWGFAYLNGDGFGTISEAFARRNCWDWSHVRDSSPEGVVRMARAIIMLRRSNIAIKNLRIQHAAVTGRKV
jgi:hypothetical protein